MIVFDYYNLGEGLQGPTWIKRCRLCGLKPLELFSRDKSKNDGLRNTCKDCDNHARKQRGYGR